MPSDRALSFETSAFDDAAFHFTVNLPWAVTYGPAGKRRDFARADGLLDYVCHVVNAHRRSVISAEVLQELQRWRRELAELLQAAVEGRLDNPSDEFLADISARFEKGVQWTRRLARARGGAAFRYDANVTSSDGFYALLAALLMHAKYRQLIRHCPQCSNFFVRAGKRVFCSRMCAKAANDAGVLERQKKQRLRRAAEELLSHVASHAKRAATIKQAFKNHPDVTTPEQLAEHAKALLQPSRKGK